MAQTLTINNSIIQYSIKNNLHVEYFIWAYLRGLNDSGLFLKKELNDKIFKKSTIINKLKNNVFFKVTNDKIILTSVNKLPIYASKHRYRVEIKDATSFASKIANHSFNLIKGWNSTTIKYFLISIYSSRFEDKKPYALCLINEDLGVSKSTIKRALVVFGVIKYYKFQFKESQRSYYDNNKLVNLSPNYYKMPIGERIIRH